MNGKSYNQDAKNGSSENIGTTQELKTLLNVESNQSNALTYPKRVFFIIGQEFCERFNFIGMQAILILYLKNKLGYSPKDATVIYHAFTMCVYFTCIFGAILSDVWLGRFKTIIYLSIVYAIGSFVLAIGAIPAIGMSAEATLFIGLSLIALGSGGIKPCVLPFGGDQFKLPEQAAQFQSFYSLFYFAICLSAFISIAVTPVLRQDVHCFGEPDCYSLAFGVPAILMIIAIAFFFIGKSTYAHVKTSSENLLLQVTKCISNAISTKMRERHTNPRKNLLDYSIDKFGYELVNDIRTLSKILVLYLPLPIFWTVSGQQGSRWILQAKKMNGDIGFYVISPDQMPVVSTVLMLVSIPLFETVIYHLLSKIGIRRPLQKMVLGGILAGLAFLITAFIQFKIESSPKNSVNMLWQLPQHVIMTMSTLMFSVTGLSFSYEQAPDSMKSVVTSFWMLTIAVGNLIVVILAKVLEDLFKDKLSYEFLLYAILMFLDMIVFIFLARRYQSSNASKIDSKVESKEQNIPLNKSGEKTAL